jgi:(S)-ureidoglycine aminohydrolase
MHRLGHTRSVRQPDHLLLTPDTFVRAPLPGMQNATAVVHVSPAVGARFTEYTAEFEPGGAYVIAGGTQRFVYVLDGELTLTAGGQEHTLLPNDYCYIAQVTPASIRARAAARAAVIEKPYQPLDRVPPPMLVGRESAMPGQPLMGDDALAVRILLPDDIAFDFAVNTMTFQPGAALAMVEIHVMEHGLLMLAGGGVYRLGESWYPVSAGDFIWMASYCPQWFGALGKIPAKYLIYKDWNRHPLAVIG